MTKQAIIEQTIKAINQLPADKAEEISSFAAFVIKRFEEQQLTEGLKQLTVESQTFDFLNEEEELYSASDLKEIYSND
ncbi:MAG: hypothetical protein EOP42_30695 [Sphingobacteriaceae bacterium]|nr:MAG: hypothetical protein EOP42_30695 [Sphingobacteriaceae bacterium]